MADDDEEFKARAMSLARTGVYESFAQIGVALEAQGFAGAIARIGQTKRFKVRLNEACRQARLKAPD